MKSRFSVVLEMYSRKYLIYLGIQADGWYWKNLEDNLHFYELPLK